MKELREIFADDYIKVFGRRARPLSLVWWVYRGIQFGFYVGVLGMGYLTIYMISLLA